MNEHGEREAEGVFEVFWFQHNPDDWMAEVVNRRTGERRRVYSLAELIAFIQPPHHHEYAHPVEPGQGR